VGVSAFGFGGTNAHAVLTSAPALAGGARDAAAARSLAGPGEAGPRCPRPPLMLSARSPAALREGARRMAALLREREDLGEYDIAYAAALRRDVHGHRLSAVGPDRRSVAQALQRFAETGMAEGIVAGRHRAQASQPAFVYSGNGSQWAGMGLQLLEKDGAFRAAVEEVDALLAARAGSSIIEELRAAAASGRMGLAEVAQPALFALQVGLTRMFLERGIRPAAVCGHSVGEVAAAWASGALALEDAVRVVHERSARQAGTRGKGCMSAVALGAADAVSILTAFALGERIAIAAVNSPTSVTVSGDADAMGRFEAILAQRRVACRRLALDYAFHSPAMDPIHAPLVRALEGLHGRAPAIPWYSTVTAARVEADRVDPEYWWRNVREPVQFAATIRALLESGVNTFVEIGPRAVLTGYIHECVRQPGGEALVVSALQRGEPEERGIAAAEQMLEVSGVQQDRGRLFPEPGRWVDLPHYPWQRERFWHPQTDESSGFLQREVIHPLLGYALHGEPLHWENHLDTMRLPHFADHSVGGGAVFPAAGFVEMALAAARARRPGSAYVIEDLEIHSALLLERERSRIVRLRVDPVDGRMTIASRARGRDDAWRTHVTGRLVADCIAAAGEAPERPARAPDVAAAAHYEFTRALGLEYGPAFQSVTGVWHCGEGVLGAIAMPACVEDEADRMLLHPAILDGAFQLLADVALRRQASAPREDPAAFLPVRIERLELVRPRARVSTACLLPGGTRRRSRRSALADFTLFDESGALVAVARGVRFRAAHVQRGDGHAARWIGTRAVPMPRREPGYAARLPAVPELAAACAQRLHAAPRAAARQRYAQEVEPLLDALCASFAERGLRELSSAAKLHPEHWTQSGRVAPDASPLLRNLVQMLADDGVLQDQEGGWQWRARRSLPPAEEIWSSLIADYPQYGSITARVGTAGLRLAERLRSGREKRGLQAPAGALAWIDACTREEAAEFGGAVSELLERVLAMQPPHERLRVLRYVGALPPEDSDLPCLPALDADRCDLVVAAPTQEILDEMRGRVSWSAGITTMLLDLEGAGPPGSAAAEPFHVIVAAEGLADGAAPALRLQRLRRQLFRGGLLVVLEQFPSRALDLVYGLDPRWWKECAGSEAGSRLRAPGAWVEQLLQAGFEDAQPVLDAPHALSGPYLLLARAADCAAAASESAPSEPAPGTWLLVQEEAGYSNTLARSLAAELRSRGQQVLVAVAGAQYARADARRFTLDPAAALHWDQLIAELRRDGTELRGWIHLAGLEPGDGLPARARPEAATRRAAAQELRAAVLLSWLQACSRNAIHPDIWVVGAQAGLWLLPPPARPPAQEAAPDRVRDAALWGLTRVAMQEFPELRLRWIDLAHPLRQLDQAGRLAQEMLDPDAEDEILLTEAGRFVPRMGIVPAPRVSLAPALVRPRWQLDFDQAGSFRNLSWRQDAGHDALEDDEVEIDVRAAGLNFRDVMYAMGLLPEEAVEDGFCGPTLGMEVSGVVTRTGAGAAGLRPGEAVIAFAPASFSTRVRTRALAVVPKPADWSFSAAATVPIAFFTAYYALVELARVREGERVLIHGAAGGVGIAAVQLARHLGAEVFATAGTPEKRDFVELLGADRVFDSREPAFDDAILRATGGEGVDVILNSLAGEAVHRNLRLLRPFGRMLELGKRDYFENSRVGMRPFRNNISYFGIDADQLLTHRPQVAGRVFAELMTLLAAGSLRPLPHRTFPASEAQAAFRHMQAARHIGKIVLTFPENFDPAGPLFAEPPAPALRADATYLVTGGLSGFGLRTAWWLVRRGARHLALLGRRGAAAPEAQDAIAQFSAAGVSAQALACDVADASALSSALADIAERMPPLRGVVHAAMVIEDALLRDLSRDALHRVLAPKIVGGLNLHEATRGLPLDHFVLFSSATTLFGNPGQGAYVAANMAIEALAEERRALGLPATCVAWGPIGDAGYLARNERVRDALVGRIGGRALLADDALRGLERLLGAKATGLGLLELDWQVLGRFLPAARAPKFGELARLAGAPSRGLETARDLRRRLEELGATELDGALAEIVRGEIAQILRTAPERIETDASLFDLGMDSLMAVELATSIEARLGIQLSALSLGDGPTIERVVRRIVQQLRPGESGAERAEGGDELVEQVRAVAARHASDLDLHEAEALSADLKARQAEGGSGMRSLTGKGAT
jgi:acyl transferase domain-containing protein/NADPH:quinone reductase-like Zn-dependent oxidoreductase/NAD(P)-dependent dehydrogenase (short-subunit alcohol dehydrogenase family)/acyl carrier protein